MLEVIVLLENIVTTKTSLQRQLYFLPGCPGILLN